MPLALVGAGLAVAGTSLSIAGQQEAKSAMAKTRAAENAQQQGLQQQANAITTNSIAKSTPQVANDQLTAGAAARTNLTQALQSAAVPIAQANAPTGGGSGRAGTAGTAWSNLVAGNQAKAGSYQDWETQQSIKNAQASQKLGILNNFSQGDASLMPIEMQVASQKGDKLSGWGSLISALGAVTGMAGAASAGMAGGSATGGATSAANNSAIASEFSTGASNNIGQATAWDSLTAQPFY
jgi:hypothetical protein